MKIIEVINPRENVKEFVEENVKKKNSKRSNSL